MNICVIGTGLMGEYHTRLYRQMKDVNLVGISDINNERVNELSTKYNCEGFNDYKELLKQKCNDGNGIDAVSICVPTILHKEIAIEVMKLGIKAILLEKPISNNIKDANEIINIAEKTNTLLMIGHIERFNPAIIEIKKIIDSGKIGVVVSITAKRVGPYPPRIRDIGIIIDSAVHDIDVISYLFNRYPTDIYAVDGHNKGSNEVLLGKVGLEDRATIIMKFDDGKVGVIEANWLTPHKIRTLDVVGFDGVINLDYIEQTINIYKREKIEKIELKKKEPLLNELTHFIDCVKNKKYPSVTGNDGLMALKIALAASESHKTNNIIRMF